MYGRTIHTPPAAPDLGACRRCDEPASAAVPDQQLCLGHLRAAAAVKVPGLALEPRLGSSSVVYYVLFGDRVKIGTTTDLRSRLAQVPHDELLGVEPGGRDVERIRHEQFADYHVRGEWFHHHPALAEHIATLSGWT